MTTDSNLNKQAEIRTIIVRAFSMGRDSAEHFNQDGMAEYRKAKVEACQELETEIEALITEESHRARKDELKSLMIGRTPSIQVEVIKNRLKQLEKGQANGN